MNYKLTDEITNLYKNYYDNSYYIEYLETEHRFKLLLLVKTSQLEVTTQDFEDYVDDFSQDELYNLMLEERKLNLFDYFVEKLEYKDRELDNGCILMLYIKIQYKDLVYNKINNSTISDYDISKFELI